MIVDYINNHQAEFWILIGFALLVAEVVTGISVGVFLFAGLGSLVTGLLMLAGLVPETWLAGIGSVGICSGLCTTLLWKPLRKLQGGREQHKETSSDFIGLEFILDQHIDLTTPGKKRYSGIDWRVEIDAETGATTLAAGQHVAVTSVDAGIFRVKPI